MVRYQAALRPGDCKLPQRFAGVLLELLLRLQPPDQPGAEPVSAQAGVAAYAQLPSQQAQVGQAHGGQAQFRQLLPHGRRGR